MSAIRAAPHVRRWDVDWPAALGVLAYFASWGAANIWTGASDYWFALRLYPLGLLLTVALLAVMCLALLWRERPASIVAKCVWSVLVVLEINEIWVYATCRLLNNPLLDAAGRRIGDVEMAVIWGITVERAACSRVLDVPSTALSFVGAGLLVWLILIAPIVRRRKGAEDERLGS